MKIENEEELKKQIQDCVFPIHITENLKFSNRGLTKREYFAIMAMQGILSNTSFSKDLKEGFKVLSMCFAVNIADDLLEALNNKPCQH